MEWLQSLEDPEVAFALLGPFTFRADYAFELSDADADALGMHEPSDALIRCVLTLAEDPAKITANLVAPLVFSRRTHIARQVIVQGADYDMRYPLFLQVQAEAEEEATSSELVELQATA